MGHALVLLVRVRVLVLILHRQSAFVRRHPLPAALAYGFILWLVMYGLVLPLRFGMPFPSPKPRALAFQWFAHLILVGLPFGLVARRSGRW